MSAPYLPESSEFKKLNFVDLVAYNVAAAIWGASSSNSALFAFDSKYSFKMKLLIAWLWALTTVSQGLTTTQLKENYVLWGFIKPDSTIRVGITNDVINLMAGIVSSSVQGFFVYEIWKNSRESRFIPIFAAPPLLLPSVIPLSSIIAPSNSLLDFYRKDLLLSTLFVQATLNICIFSGLSKILAPRYLMPQGRKEKFSAVVLRLILFSINSGFWTVLVSISNIVMLFYLYSYTSLFTIYSHLTTTVHLMTLLSFLGSVSTTNEDDASSESRPALARIVKKANATSGVMDAQFEEP